LAINQISTSVSILNTGLSGFLGVSLTNYETSALSAIASGSCVEIGGAFFLCQSETAINASSWAAITTATNGYLTLTPSGTAGSQIVTAAWTATAPVWSESKQGWYASAASIVRVIGSAYKVSNTQQETKTLYVKGRDRIFTKKIDIGPWDMTSTTVTILQAVLSTPLHVETFIRNDAASNTSYVPIHFVPHGHVTLDASGGYVTFVKYSSGIVTINLLIRASGIFQTTDFNDTSFSRGYVVITYEA